LGRFKSEYSLLWVQIVHLRLNLDWANMDWVWNGLGYFGCGSFQFMLNLRFDLVMGRVIYFAYLDQSRLVSFRMLVQLWIQVVQFGFRGSGLSCQVYPWVSISLYVYPIHKTTSERRMMWLSKFRRKIQLQWFKSKFDYLLGKLK